MKQFQITLDGPPMSGKTHLLDILGDLGYKIDFIRECQTPNNPKSQREIYIVSHKDNPHNDSTE